MRRYSYIQKVKEIEDNLLQRMYNVKNVEEASSVLSEAQSMFSTVPKKIIDAYDYAVNAFYRADAWVDRIKGTTTKIGYNEEG